MNADYIKQIVDKANELIELIESAAANPRLEGDQFQNYIYSKAHSLELIRKGVAFAIEAETIN